MIPRGMRLTVALAVEHVVVFVGEVNLAPSAGISPFHKTITADELKRIHEKKISRVPKLKTAMQEWLLNSADSLASVPPEAR